MANYGPPGANRPEPWHGQPSDGARPWHDGHRYGDGPPPAGGHPGSGGQPWHDGHPQHEAYPDDGGYPQRGGYPQHEAYPSDGGYPGAETYPRGGTYPRGPYPDGQPTYLGGEPDRYPPQPADAPRPARGRGRMVAVLAVLALLVLGGGATLFYLAGTDTDSPPADALPSATANSSDQPSAGLDVSPNALAPESSADPRFARVGQCVRNDGPTGGRPKLLVTECTPKTYEVLRRFDGATSGEQDAEAKCADVGGYTDWYFYNSELDTLDFVLCLKLR